MYFEGKQFRCQYSVTIIEIVGEVVSGTLSMCSTPLV